MLKLHRFSIITFALIFLAACGGSKAPAEEDIVLTEWAIEPGNVTIRAGEVTFNIQNDGVIEHDFVIEGYEQMNSGPVPPGDSKTQKISLEPGTYSFVCSIEGHKENGMVGTLFVEE